MKCEVEYGPDGLATQLVWRPPIEIDAEDAIAAIQSIRDLAWGKTWIDPVELRTKCDEEIDKIVKAIQAKAGKP